MKLRSNVHFDQSMLRRLAQAVLKTGMSKAEFIRRAVEAALQRLKL